MGRDLRRERLKSMAPGPRHRLRTALTVRSFVSGACPRSCELRPHLSCGSFISEKTAAEVAGCPSGGFAERRREYTGLGKTRRIAISVTERPGRASSVSAISMCRIVWSRWGGVPKDCLKGSPEMKKVAVRQLRQRGQRDRFSKMLFDMLLDHLLLPSR